MLRTTPRRLGVAAALVVLAALCQLVAHLTYHHTGAAGVLSWITFVGFWVCAGAALLGLLLTALLARGRRTARP